MRYNKNVVLNEMRKIVFLFCRISLLIAVLCTVAQASENASSCYNNMNQWKYAVESATLPNTSAWQQQQQEIQLQLQQQAEQLRHRQQVREKLIVRAEKYIKSASVGNKGVVPTAFVLEGLLDFGLSVNDPYVQSKSKWLISLLAHDGQYYDADGYRLHLETAYIHRIIHLLKCKSSEKEHFMGDEIIAQVQQTIVSGLPANAVKFLQNSFAIPDTNCLRASYLTKFWAQGEEYHLLADWNTTPVIPAPMEPVPAPGLPLSNQFIAAVSAPVSGFDYAEIGSLPSYYLNYKPANYALQAPVRPHGYILIAQTEILRL